jgi:hypothetical protein
VSAPTNYIVRRDSRGTLLWYYTDGVDPRRLQMYTLANDPELRELVERGKAQRACERARS